MEVRKGRSLKVLKKSPTEWRLKKSPLDVFWILREYLSSLFSFLTQLFLPPSRSFSLLSLNPDFKVTSSSWWVNDRWERPPGWAYHTASATPGPVGLREPPPPHLERFVFFVTLFSQHWIKNMAWTIELCEI